MGIHNLPSNFTKTDVVVIFLLQQANVLDKGYIVHFDNWYCSLKLVEYLFYQRKTGAHGTIRVSKGIPSTLSNARLPPNSSKFMRKKQVLAVKFKDKNDVYVVSTVDKASIVEKEKFVKGGEKLVVKKPAHIDLYNKNMGGVDIQDQNYFLSFSPASWKRFYFSIRLERVNNKSILTIGGYRKLNWLQCDYCVY